MRITADEYRRILYPLLFAFRPGSLGTMRVAGRVLDALEAAGIQVEGKEDGFSALRMADPERDFAFTPEELRVIATALEQGAGNLHTGHARGLPDLYDRVLEAAKGVA
jgi:predicted DNA-binding transcriptional regulator YafY